MTKTDLKTVPDFREFFRGYMLESTYQGRKRTPEEVEQTLSAVEETTRECHICGKARDMICVFLPHCGSPELHHETRKPLSRLVFYGSCLDHSDDVSMAKFEATYFSELAKGSENATRH